VRRRLARDGPPWTRDHAGDIDTVTVLERGTIARLVLFGVNMGWRVVPAACDGGTVDQATGHPRLQALRLPDPASEPAFERFQPF
jgi:hypothetical protein